MLQRAFRKSVLYRLYYPVDVRLELQAKPSVMKNWLLRYTMLNVELDYE